jgi:prepilin-type N-terminal cleavage/methylation domain-containing protein
MKKPQNKQKGFTIIEVLIVLAIAGLILLIVFLAVPALQRNSRNTQRRNQAAGYGSAISEFVSNNNGAIPSTAAHVAAINALSADSIMTEPSGTAAPLTGTQGALATIDTMRIVTGAICDTTTIGATTATGANTRSVALQFTVEGSGNAVIGQCQNI